MEYDKIKQLIDDMGNSKLTSLDIEFPDGTKISAKKEQKTIQVVDNAEKIQTVTIQNEKNLKENNEIQNSEIENKQELEGNIVKSPMVGTFYIKPSPSANPYVEIGKQVKKGDVLCIIEAMKLMNEIESEFDGEVVEIYVKDGEVVEYGKPLFRIV